MDIFYRLNHAIHLYNNCNENTNGLIRQFFPKGTNFNHVSQKEVNNVIFLLNNRPRKTRNNKSPNEIFNNQFIPLLNI